MGDFLAERIPPIDPAEMERAVRLADRQLLSRGITTIHDASSRNDLERWGQFNEWKASSILKPRLNIMLGYPAFREYEAQASAGLLDGGLIRISGVKIILDETTGRLHPSQADLDRMVYEIHRSGLQVAIHAVEKTAVEAACGSIEKTLKTKPRKDHRHRIEHCSVCPPDLADRISALNIVVVTQPLFIFRSGDRYLVTVPKEYLRHLYPIHCLMKSGIVVAGSSDCPIVSPNPLLGIYAAVTRMSETGRTVVAKEKISPLDALKLHTFHAAFAGFEESVKGTLCEGKLADMVILSGDPTKIPPGEIKDIQIETTIIGGEVVWNRTG
jgi:predicted amidohydrolase YtcJ